METSESFRGLLALAHKLDIDVEIGGIETTSKSIIKYRFSPETRRSCNKSILVMHLRLQDVDIAQKKSVVDRLTCELAHELGHYMAAPKGRRRHKDYGIKVKSKFSELDELKANFVEQELRRKFEIKDFKFSKGSVGTEDYLAAEDWWLSVGQIKVQTILEFLM